MKQISYRHIMPGVLKIKNGFKGSVIVSLLVTNRNISIISARKPGPEDYLIGDGSDEDDDGQSEQFRIKSPKYFG